MQNWINDQSDILLFMSDISGSTTQTWTLSTELISWADVQINLCEGFLHLKVTS